VENNSNGHVSARSGKKISAKLRILLQLLDKGIAFLVGAFWLLGSNFCLFLFPPFRESALESPNDDDGKMTF